MVSSLLLRRSDIFLLRFTQCVVLLLILLLLLSVWFYARRCVLFTILLQTMILYYYIVCAFQETKKLIIIVESLLRTFYVALFCFKNAHTHDASPWLVETNINIQFCVHILLWYNNNIILIFWSSSIPHFVINPWMDGLPRRRYLVQFCYYITPFFTSLQPTTPSNVTTHQ